MKCPYCGYSESKVIDSRPAEEGSSIRRRRECLACKKRFTTYETVESLPMVVVKKDGSRQSFDRRKVLGGMIRACEKRPVPLADLERIAEEIEQDLMDILNTGDFEILDIGRLRLVFQPEDKYNTRPWFEVRYPDYTGVYTKRHFLRKPGNKRRPQKGG